MRQDVSVEAAGRRLRHASPLKTEDHLLRHASSPKTKGSQLTSTSLDDLDSFWERQKVGWHAVYLGLLGIVALLVGLNDGLTGTDRLIAGLLLTAMAMSYLLIGRRALGSGRKDLAVVQLALSWGCLYGLLGLGVEDAYFLLFALIPHVWAMLSTRQAVIGAIVLIAGLTVVEISRVGWSVNDAVDVLPDFVLQMGLALLLGLFITGVFGQAEKRATLIDELERTRAELAETEHARGVLAERQRLAHEIHDTLAQGFTSVLTLAQAIDVTLERDPATARERLALLESTARENLAEARALVNALAPLDLQDVTLPEALERVAARFARETDVAVDVQIEGDPRPLAANAEVVLLRAAQEALSNVRKHSDAGRVSVALHFRPGSQGSTSIAIVDDGRGFDPGQTTDTGFGLHGMRSRIEQVGGVLDIVSAPGMGTTVRATLG